MSDIDTTYEPNINDTNSYRSVSGENIYKFMDDAFHGQNGFRDGSYLIPHMREVFYDARRDLAYYKNYIRPIVRAMIDPVFQEPADRSITVGTKVVTDGMFATEFLMDATGNGMPLQGYTWEAIQTARLHGVTFTVVDNFKSADMPEIKSEALDERKFPYVYNKTAEQVEDWETDRFGNMLSITFCEDPVIVKNEQTQVIEKQPRWGRWTDNEYQILKKDADGNFVVIDTIPHNLGVVPVVSSYGNRKQQQRVILVDPPLYDMAKINHAIYNKDSEIRDQERAQGFAVFYVQTDDKIETSTTGTKNLWTIPIDTSIPPGFASPDPAILTGLVENGEKLRESMFAIAGQHGVTGVADSASGIAKQWDFKAHESVLQTTGKMAETLETRVMDIFKLYTGEDFEYLVHYKDEFQPSNTTQIIVDNTAILDMGLPAKPASHVKKESYLLRAKEMGWDEDVTEENAKAFEEEAEEEKENESFSKQDRKEDEDEE